MNYLKLYPKSKQIPGRDHLPCPYIGCGSSDGYTEYDDGHGYCYSCNKRFKLEGQMASEVVALESGTSQEGEKEKDRWLPPRTQTSFQTPGLRGISPQSEAFYGIKTEVLDDGTPYARHYPYPWSTTKVRVFKDHTTLKREDKFYYKGDGTKPGLFGRDRFDPGESKFITIVEGEEDAAAARDMLGPKYPVVSVRSGSTAKKDCDADREWLNAFSRIILCLDNDDVGKKATKEVARLFDYNKVHTVLLTQYKDANDYLQRGATETFRNLWYGAKRIIPESIISTWSEFGTILKGTAEKPIGTYPFGQLQSMARGFREGEIVLIDAQEGVGKTEFVRALEHHLLVTTDHNIGCIHLEESKKRQLLGLVGYHIRVPIHLKEDEFTDELLLEKLKELTKRDERLYLYSHFGSDDPDIILDAIRFMVSSGNCKFIFLDHITQVVSGLRGIDDERRVLDYMMTRLNMMVQELNFCLVLVSHVNDFDQTRGSRMISKAPHFRLSLSRNLEAEKDEDRNTTKLVVRKNRFGSTTGPAGHLLFDPDTFLLTDKPSFKLAPVKS